jgi:predicted acetyltransferase
VRRSKPRRPLAADDPVTQPGIDVRVPTADEFETFRHVLARNFGVDPRPEAAEGFARIWEPDRAFCAWDGPELVGTSGSFSLKLTVPGGTIATGGTTMVSVAPTHRRRGILRQIMAAHLNDVADRGEPLAALWSSESSIYGRFGYGVAAQGVDLRIPRQYTSLHRLAPNPAAIRLVDEHEARRQIPAIYERVASWWPGFFARSEAWWDERWFKDPPDRRNGATALRFALTTGNDGYAMYRQKLKFEQGNSAGELTVVDLLGTSPESWAGLWSFILNHDLTATIDSVRRPPDDPIFDLLETPRQMKERRSDSIWIRPNDPATALAGRRYQTAGHLVIEIVDQFRERRVLIELDGGPDGATCLATDKPPDLVLDIEDLGACYLGWARFRALARAGRIGGDTNALTLADQMFTWEPQPWCPEVF